MNDAELDADAYAIRNDQGYWVGIWNDRAAAENVLAKGNPAHGERIVPVVIAGPRPFAHISYSSDVNALLEAK